MRTKRICAGEYTVSHGEYVVTVSYFDHLKGWVAAANWDRSLYTDVVATLRQAKREANGMINDAITTELKRLSASNQRRLYHIGEHAKRSDCTASCQHHPDDDGTVESTLAAWRNL